MYSTHHSLVAPCSSSQVVHAKIDRNQNGKLECEEIQHFLNEYCESNSTTPPQAYQVQVVYQQLDLNGDGEHGDLRQLMGQGVCPVNCTRSSETPHRTEVPCNSFDKGRATDNAAVFITFLSHCGA